MALMLYFHPLASFCHKVLIALYENGTAFDGRFVDFGKEEDSAAILGLWPVGKIPVLRDEARDMTVPETSIIIEYLDRHHPGATPLIPTDPALALEARLWDRFFDLYIQVPMQKIVIDRLRPEGGRDAIGVAEARATLKVAYGMIERRMAGRRWVVAEDFGIAECAAAPALFYAGIVEPFPADHPSLAAYFERLIERPSVRRTLKEAQPYFKFFPYLDRTPARFLAADAFAD